MNQPIQFLLHQLANNEQNIKRFNLLNKIQIKLENDQIVFWTTEHKKGYCKEWWTFNMLSPEHIELFIRTCLSRVNGEAVLGVFNFSPQMINVQSLHQSCEECGFENVLNQWEYKSDILYEAFDWPLHNGKPRDEAIQALHEKMLELVPQYQLWIDKNTPDSIDSIAYAMEAILNNNK